MPTKQLTQVCSGVLCDNTTVGLVCKFKKDACLFQVKLPVTAEP